MSCVAFYTLALFITLRKMFFFLNGHKKSAVPWGLLRFFQSSIFYLYPL